LALGVKPDPKRSAQGGYLGGYDKISFELFSTKTVTYEEIMVPRAGIEPATRGFSMLFGSN
jgi:hypothetical protein